MQGDGALTWLKELFFLCGNFDQLPLGKPHARFGRTSQPDAILASIYENQPDLLRGLSPALCHARATGCLKIASAYSMEAARDRHHLGHGFVCSMSRKGNCWDNAVAERFFLNLSASGSANTPTTPRPGLTSPATSSASTTASASIQQWVICRPPSMEMAVREPIVVSEIT